VVEQAKQAKVRKQRPRIPTDDFSKLFGDEEEAKEAEPAAAPSAPASALASASATSVAPPPAPSAANS